MAIRTSTRSTSSSAADPARTATAGAAGIASKPVRGTRRTRAGAPAGTHPSSRPGHHQQCLDAVAAANTWLAGRAQLPQGPWSGLAGLPRKVADGSCYTGTNVIILMAAQDTLGYRSARWGGFSALKDKGLKLTKGSHCSCALFGGYVERKSSPSDTPKTGLDAGNGVANAQGSSPAAQRASSQGDPAKPDAQANAQANARRSVIPVLQPVSLFSAAQCEGFLPDPRQRAPQDRLDSIRNQWLEACAQALALFAVWSETHPGVGFSQEEGALVTRLATDFAVLRRTGETEAITAPLPVVPDLGARFMKVCGVAWELSGQVADKVFGPEVSGGVGSGDVAGGVADAGVVGKAVAPAQPVVAAACDPQAAGAGDTPEAGTAPMPAEPVQAVKAPRKPRRAKKRVPAPADTTSMQAGDSLTAGGAVSPPAAVQPEAPDWIGVW